MTATAFTIGSKGLDAAIPLASGELLVRGYLTRWSELDRESERFIRGSFTRAIKSFMRGLHRPFVYHHAIRDVLGEVLQLEEDSIGVRLLAKVNRQPESSPLRHVYEAIKNGTIKGLSAGGIFRRRPGIDGHPEIHEVAELVECSATPAPVLASTSLEVVAEGKAITLWGPECFGREGEAACRADALRRAEAELARVKLNLAALEARALARS